MTSQGSKPAKSRKAVAARKSAMFHKPATPSQSAASTEPNEPAVPIANPATEPPPQPKFGSWMGSMWLYTTLRFGLFFALWGLLFLLGVSGYLGALIALVLSVPLSLVLLSGPRARFTRQLELRVQSRKVDQHDLATELDPDAERD